MTSLQLHVDESGPLTPGDPSVVLGVVLPECDPGPLRQRLEAIFPAVPWPPHASPLQIPVTRIWGAWARAARGLPAPTGSYACLAAFGEGLRSHHAGRALFAAAQQEAEPDRQLLHDADRALATRHPKSHGWLRALKDREAHLLGQLLDELAEAGAFTVIGAGDDDDPLPDLGPLRADPYLSRLTALLERTLLLLWQEGGPSTPIWTRIATRSTHLQGFRRHQLADARTLAHLQPHLAPSLSAQRRAQLSASARIVAFAEPQRWDAHTHPGIVLADHLARRAARILRRDRPWEPTRQALNDSLRLPVERLPRANTQAGPLPSVAAVGAPRRRILDHLAQQPSDAGDETWTHEQADRWVAALGPGGWP